MTAEDLDLQRAEALLRLGRPDEALRRLTGLVAAAPDDGRRLVLLASALLQTGRVEDAVAAADRAVAVDPGDPAAHRLAADALLKLDRCSESARAASEGIRLAPHDERNHILLAYALASLAQSTAALRPRRRRQLQQARAAAEEAVRLAPDSADAHTAAGYVAFIGGPRRAAAASFRRALQIDPHHAIASANLGALGVNAYRLLEAGQQLGAALRSDPSQEESRANLALLLGRGLGMASALSLIAVLLQAISLESEMDGGSRTWRTAVGAACLGVLLFASFAVRRLPPSVCRYLRIVLRRRPLYQLLALVAAASSANVLAIPALPRGLALDLAYLHLALAVAVLPVLLGLRLAAAAVRVARRHCSKLVRLAWRRLLGFHDRGA